MSHTGFSPVLLPIGPGAGSYDESFSFTFCDGSDFFIITDINSVFLNISRCPGEII